MEIENGVIGLRTFAKLRIMGEGIPGGGHRAGRGRSCSPVMIDRYQPLPVPA